MDKLTPPITQLKLGLDTFSLRNQEWNLSQILEYAYRNKLHALQVGAHDLESLDIHYLTKLKDAAARLNITIEPGLGSISTLSSRWDTTYQSPHDYLLAALATSKALGADTCRVFLGNATDRKKGINVNQLVEGAINTLRSVRNQALDSGVKLAVENHGEIHSHHVKTIIEEAGREFVGFCFDAGNATVLAEDPLFVLESLAAYITTAHIRDSVVFAHPLGAAVQWVPLGEGNIDIRNLTNRFLQTCPTAHYHLEIITGRPPQVVPYLEPQFWAMDSTMPVGCLAMFERRVRAGYPNLNAMLTTSGPPPDCFRSAMKHQDLQDIERSIEWVRQNFET